MSFNIKTKEEIEQAERDFQDCLQKWSLNQDDKKSWDKMFFLVLDACTNIAKSKARNKHIPDLEGKSLDSAAYVMEQIKKGARPSKLSSYCYLRVVKYLLDVKTQFYERNVVLTDDFVNVTEEQEESY